MILLVFVNKKALCHSEGAFFATKESLTAKVGILRFAQDDILDSAN